MTRPFINEQITIYHFFARDPSGYVIEVRRFLDAGRNGVIA